MYKKLKNNNIPTILIDRDINGIHTSCVTPNNYDGAYTATEYLITLKHRKIAFLSCIFSLSSEKERLNGYCDALRNYNIAIDKNILFLEKQFNIDDFVNKAKEGQFTAVFAVNDRWP